MSAAERLTTFETAQPWIVYGYGRTHDHWWPVHTSTRVLGRAKIDVTCAVCGHHEVISLKMPRFRKIENRGHHPARLDFMARHLHEDRGAPMSWALPLLNLAALPGGLNLDALAMRLEADMNAVLGEDAGGDRR